MLCIDVLFIKWLRDSKKNLKNSIKFPAKITSKSDILVCIYKKNISLLS